MDHLHSQLAAADTTLSAEILDAIDAIVAPGMDLAAQGKKPTPAPAIANPTFRRRASWPASPLGGQRARVVSAWSPQTLKASASTGNPDAAPLR